MEHTARDFVREIINRANDCPRAFNRVLRWGTSSAESFSSLSTTPSSIIVDERLGEHLGLGKNDNPGEADIGKALFENGRPGFDNKPSDRLEEFIGPEGAELLGQIPLKENDAKLSSESGILDPTIKDVWAETGQSYHVLTQQRVLERRPATEEQDEGTEKPPYTEEPIEILLRSNGAKDCLMMTLNEQIVENISTIKNLKQELDTTYLRFTRIQGQAEFLEAEIATKNHNLEHAETDEEADEARDDSTKLQRKLDHTWQQRDQMDRAMSLKTDELRDLRIAAETLVENVLEEGNLLLQGTRQAESGFGDGEDSIDANTSSHNSISRDDLVKGAEEPNSTNEDGFPTDIDQQPAGSVIGDLQEAQVKFYRIEEKFGRREEDYEDLRHQYEAAVAEGKLEPCQTEFDHNILQHGKRITRALIQAEEDYEEAKARARAVGLLPNQYDQESQFVDHEDDGQSGSEAAYDEAYEPTPRDFTRIESWRFYVAGCVDEETDELSVRDLGDEEWEARPVDLGDSLSVVDYSRNGDRIQRWVCICAEMREESEAAREAATDPSVAELSEET